MKNSRVLILLTVIFLWNCGPAGAQTLQWSRQFAGTRPDALSQLAVDSTGIYVAGITQGALPGQTAVSIIQDGYVRKYDPSGNVLWTQEFASQANGFSVSGMAVDSSGVYVVGAGGAGFLTKSSPVWAAYKFSPSGTLLWTKKFTASNATPQEGMASVATAGGAVYVAGHATVSNVSATPPIQEFAYVRKFDPDGNQIWSKNFSGIANNGFNATTNPIAVSADSTGVYVVGTTNGTLTGGSAPQFNTVFIRKYDLDGNVQWSNQFGNNLNLADRVYNASAGPSGIYVVGSTQGLLGIQPLPTFDFDAWVRKYDPAGHVQWTQQFGTIDREEAFGVFADDGGAYVAGYARSGLTGTPIGNNTDAFVRRFDTNGNALFTIQTGSAILDFAYGVGVDSSGIYIGGYSDAVTTIPGTLTNKADSFVHKYSAPAPGGPVIATGGIVNNGSFAPSPAPMAPGSIAAIFGTGLNDGSQVLSSAFDANGKLVTTLGGASVTVGGFAAPLFYSTLGQLGIQIPYEVAAQSTAQVIVTVNGQASQPATINLTATRPGLFTVSQDGRGTAVALHSDGITPVSAGNPAHPNEVIILYGTGFGPLATPLGTGVPANAQLTATTPTVTIDGLPADVQFSGMAPGFVGLNQLNVTVPGLARQNSADPIVLTIGNAQANAVTLPVAP